MEGFEINRATRMMRAGNEVSETNKKLREAVCSFVAWLSERIEGNIPEEIGWKIVRERDGSTSLYFPQSFVNTKSNASIERIVGCCRALAGPEGERFLLWLESEIGNRKSMLKVLQEIRSTISPSPLKLTDANCREFGRLIVAFEVVDDEVPDTIYHKGKIDGILFGSDVKLSIEYALGWLKRPFVAYKQRGTLGVAIAVWGVKPDGSRVEFEIPEDYRKEIAAWKQKCRKRWESIVPSECPYY